ncbi:MAG: hypothetical protein H6765_11200 [Candidatus Peribacteria bacterium]|nr:MAG: hypothetical protein H6765_11200 [Candidatus Peribacteria bacterium]
MKNTRYVVIFGIAAILFVLSWPSVDNYLVSLDTNWYVSPNAMQSNNTGEVADEDAVATGDEAGSGAMLSGDVVATGAVISGDVASTGTDLTTGEAEVVTGA